MRQVAATVNGVVLDIGKRQNLINALLNVSIDETDDGSLVWLLRLSREAPSVAMMKGIAQNFERCFIAGPRGLALLTICDPQPVVPVKWG